MKDEVSAGFKAVALSWLRYERPDAAEITSVETYGTDWDGDTEGGYHSDFEVTIRYVDAEGKPLWFDAKGETLGSLWAHVIGSWPESDEDT